MSLTLYFHPLSSFCQKVRRVFEASDFPPEILSAEDAAREQSWRDEQQRKAARP